MTVLKQWKKSYGLNIRELDVAIAECMFENISFITDIHSDIVSWDDAEDIIQEYINTGSAREFGKYL